MHVCVRVCVCVCMRKRTNTIIHYNQFIPTNKIQSNIHSLQSFNTIIHYNHSFNKHSNKQYKLSKINETITYNYGEIKQKEDIN